MIKEIQVNITLTPQELEEAIWNLDAAQQAYLIRAIAQRYKKECGKILFQLESVKNEMMFRLTKEEKGQARLAFDRILEYIQSAKSEE